MPLSVGDRLGPYEILAPLGAGGMGEVFRAKDTKLDREVAIKVLPHFLADDPERIARLDREAKVLASLNHPNIAQIYGIEQRALVMELVKGETLKGPLPLDEALTLAMQIADALEDAHEKGIVHRDLKPANIMITPAGVVKVLDFGLAKAAEAPEGSDPSNSPTLTMSPTRAGMILGTAAYMSPEQARGKTVDRRADIWAFGVVLYEMLTGRQAFTGETVSDILAAVLTKELDLEQVPVKVRKLLRRCLEKDPKQRLRDIGEARFLLEDAPPHRVGHGRPLPWIAATLLVTVAALALGFVAYRHVTEETRVLKMSVLPPDKAVFNANSLPAVSPDGRRLAFVATLDGKDSLWVRDLDSLAARALTGTDGADDPFWSPDSRSIAFFADGKLKRIEVAGGPALTLCDASGEPRGGSWNKNDTIVFAVNQGGTFRVPAAGGNATLLTTPDRASGELDHRFPRFLPDGRYFLYTVTNREREKVAIYAGDLDSKNRKLVVAANSNAVYTPPGYLLFVRERTLMAQPFDAAKLQTTGDAVPVAEQVDSSGIAGQNQFSASQNGVLAYASGASGGNLQLTWFDRSGKVTGTLGTPGFVFWGAISPDGNTVAVDRLDPQTRIFDIWLHDLTRGTASRFTFGPRANQFPVWSPDGSHIAFYSFRDGVAHPFQKATSGTARDEILSKPLGEPPGPTRVDDWSRDGRYIIMTVTNPKTKSDVWVMPTFGDRKPFPYLQTEFFETYARLSPNGQWLAYTSDESKRLEIYVQTFPTPGGKWQVSTNGGSRPVWSRDGKELYFIGADGKMMAVEVKGGTKFEAGLPKPLFDARVPVFQAWYDVSKDGRFLIPVPLEPSANTPMTVVINWTAALKK
jgi:Tol biopolymer transport system component/predicted Ser/Thr protein kinase